MSHRYLASGLSVALALSVAACGRREADAARNPPVTAAVEEPAEERSRASNIIVVDDATFRDLRVTTTFSERRQDGEQIALLGELAVDQSAYAEVGVPQAARVTRLLAQVGDRVALGQAVIELTSPELGRVRAEYVSAQARVALAQAALQRTRDLAAERIAPQRAVQEAEAALADAHASSRTARAAIAAFGADPPDDDAAALSSVFVLRAPVAGTVLERAAVLGRMLHPDEPAMRVGDLSRLWLTVHAFERDAIRIEAGARTRLGFAALPGQDFEGVVALVGRQVDAESRTVPVRIDVGNEDGLLRPGMSGSAVVPVRQTGRPIVSVPVAAVQRVNDEWVVFMPRDARSFEIRRIGRGRDLATEVEVVSGLSGGEMVVVDGAFLLKARAEQGDAGHDGH